MNSKGFRTWMPVFGFVLAFVLLVCVAMLPSIQYRQYEHIENSRLIFESDTERMDQTYGIMNSGPALTVPGGRMTISWDVESDADNVIHVKSSNGAAIEPAEIQLSAGRAQGSAELYSLDEIYDLQILVDYQNGSYIRVNQIDLTVKNNMDSFFSVGILLLGAAVLCALHACGFLTARRRGELVILLAAVFVASIPDLRANLHGGHDSNFHIARVLNLVHALRDGQIPARLGGHMQNGYGAVIGVFYPELFLYIPALMIIGGASLTYSYHVLFILINLVAALTMWYAAGRIFKSGTAGVTASVLYTLAQYRLLDVYTRFAVGEALAMSFLPLFVLGLYEVLLGDRRRWRLLALSATMICQSHMITTALCGIFSVFLAAVCFVKIIKEHRMASLVKAAGFALLLNLFFFLPMYTYSQQGVVTNVMKRDLMKNALEPAQIFLDTLSVPFAEDDGLISFPLGIGLPLVLMAAAAVYAALKKEKRDRRDGMALLMCAAGAGFIFMSTNLFPWGRMADLTFGMAEYIQFPWRLLMLTTLCFAMAGGYAASQAEENQKSLIPFAVLCMCAVYILPMVSQETRKEEYLQGRHLPYVGQYFGDYKLPHAQLFTVRDTDLVVSDGIVVSDYKKIGTSIDAYISCEQDGSVQFPLYAFDGYDVRIGDQPLQVEESEYDHMLIRFDQGMRGNLQIRFVGKTYWRIGDAISLAALLVLIGSMGKRKKISAS